VAAPQGGRGDGRAEAVAAREQLSLF
jgi:hypothetical protein